MPNKLLFILVLILALAAKAQIPKEQVVEDMSVFPQEKVELTINSIILLAGELLLYKGFVLTNSNKPSELSKVLYVSLRNEEDSIIFSHKLKVENASAYGDFFIPSTLKTGIYRLIGYTNFSRNNDQNSFIQKTVTILNTFIKPENNNSITDTLKFNRLNNNDLQLLTEKTSSEEFEIVTDKKTYGFREKVNFNVKKPLGSKEGNFVISVRKINPIEISGKLTHSKETNLPNTIYIPELRGEIISGVVLSKQDSKPAANKTISLTIPGNNYIFKLATTNTHGRFFFSIPEAYSAQESFLQLNEHDNNREEFTVLLDKTEISLRKEAPRFLKLDPNLKDWLQGRSVQIQIENAYFEIKKDSLLPIKPNLPFFANLGTVFNLDDYTRFSTIRETFIEVVTLAAIRGTGEDSKFLINNAYDPNRIAKFNNLPPLVLLDGMQILNNEYLINYNPRQITNIRVITEPYRYGPKIFSGIIAVETKKGDYLLPTSNTSVTEIELPPAVPQKYYYKPKYDSNLELTRIPDYRFQLFWQPEINFDNDIYSTSFYTSDVSGYFEITIEGFTIDGKFVSSKGYIEIED